MLVLINIVITEKSRGP